MAQYGERVNKETVFLAAAKFPRKDGGYAKMEQPNILGNFVFTTKFPDTPSRVSYIPAYPADTLLTNECSGRD